MNVGAKGGGEREEVEERDAAEEGNGVEGRGWVGGRRSSTQAAGALTLAARADRVAPGQQSGRGRQGACERGLALWGPLLTGPANSGFQGLVPGTTPWPAV